MSLDGYLLVDPASMAALQIFHEEQHPSMMGIGQPKEGFSVFGMLNRCVGTPGRRLLKLWFLRPLLDLKVRNEYTIPKHDTDEFSPLYQQVAHLWVSG